MTRHRVTVYDRMMADVTRRQIERRELAPIVVGRPPRNPVPLPQPPVDPVQSPKGESHDDERE